MLGERICNCFQESVSCILFSARSCVPKAIKLSCIFSKSPCLASKFDLSSTIDLMLRITRLQQREKIARYNTVDDAVHLIKNSNRIIILTGAGISTSSSLIHRCCARSHTIQVFHAGFPTSVLVAGYTLYCSRGETTNLTTLNRCKHHSPLCPHRDELTILSGSI